MAERYVSVSGVASAEERLQVGAGARAAELPCRLLVGIQATTKTQSIGIENSRGGNWHPVCDDIWEPFVKPSTFYDQKMADFARARGVIHFSYEYPDPESVVLQTASFLRRMSGQLLNPMFQPVGWQFNNLDLLSHDYQNYLGRIARFLEDAGAEEIRILQLPRSILESSVNRAAFARKIGCLPVTHTLLDMSGGRGEGFNLHLYEEWLGELYGEAPQLSHGIAGGLGPDNLDGFVALSNEFDNLSCDAEFLLRNNQDQSLDQTRLSPEKVCTYLMQVAEIIAPSELNLI